MKTICVTKCVRVQTAGFSVLLQSLLLVMIVMTVVPETRAATPCLTAQTTVEQEQAFTLLNDLSLNYNKPDINDKAATTVRVAGFGAGFSRGLIILDGFEDPGCRVSKRGKAILRLKWTDHNGPKGRVIVRGIRLSDEQLAAPGNITFHCPLDSNMGNRGPDCQNNHWNGGDLIVHNPGERGVKVNHASSSHDVTDLINMGVNGLVVMLTRENVKRSSWDGSFYALGSGVNEPKLTISLEAKTPGLIENFPAGTDCYVISQQVHVPGRTYAPTLTGFMCPGHTGHKGYDIIYMAGVPTRAAIAANMAEIDELRHMGDLFILDMFCQGLSDCPEPDATDFEWGVSRDEGLYFTQFLLDLELDNIIIGLAWDRQSPLSAWYIVKLIEAGVNVVGFFESDGWHSFATICSPENAARVPGDPLRCSDNGFQFYRYYTADSNGNRIVNGPILFFECIGMRAGNGECGLCFNRDNSYWVDISFSAIGNGPARNVCYALNDLPFNNMEIFIAPGVSLVPSFAPRTQFNTKTVQTEAELTFFEAPYIGNSSKARRYRAGQGRWPYSLTIEGQPPAGQNATDQGREPRDTDMAAAMVQLRDYCTDGTIPLCVVFDAPGWTGVGNTGGLLIPPRDVPYLQQLPGYVYWRGPNDFSHAAVYEFGYYVADLLVELIDGLERNLT